MQDGGADMINSWWLVSSIVLWLLVLGLAFLLCGTLRALGLLRWRLEQLEATMPSRLGRSGLKVGKKAPDFVLPSVAGADIGLHDYAGGKILLVFMQPGCGPCHRVTPDLDRLHRQSDVQVLVVQNGDLETIRKWAREQRPRFPVVVQEQFSLSKRYEMFATPFAFLIDEHGIIVSKGVINNGQHIRFLLSGAGKAGKNAQVEAEPDETTVSVS
jgi:methylamine dehydrogenase accessory protein MauD